MAFGGMGGALGDAARGAAERGGYSGGSSSNRSSGGGYVSSPSLSSLAESFGFGGGGNSAPQGAFSSGRERPSAPAGYFNVGSRGVAPFAATTQAARQAALSRPGVTPMSAGYYDAGRAAHRDVSTAVELARQAAIRERALGDKQLGQANLRSISPTLFDKFGNPINKDAVTSHRDAISAYKAYDAGRLAELGYDIPESFYDLTPQTMLGGVGSFLGITDQNIDYLGPDEAQQIALDSGIGYLDDMGQLRASPSLGTRMMFGGLQGVNAAMPLAQATLRQVGQTPAGLRAANAVYGAGNMALNYGARPGYLSMDVDDALDTGYSGAFSTGLTMAGMPATMATGATSLLGTFNDGRVLAAAGGKKAENLYSAATIDPVTDSASMQKGYGSEGGNENIYVQMAANAPIVYSSMSDYSPAETTSSPYSPYGYDVVNPSEQLFPHLWANNTFIG